MTQRIYKVAWMPVRGRRVLFARSRGQTLFYCAGGKLEAGETDIEALLREVREELSVELERGSIRHVHTFHGPSRTGGDMVMACFEGKSRGELTPSSEVEEIAWFSTLDKPRTTEMGHIILDWYKDKGLID